ncbi:MAG: SulP family inorganic anion transporter [Nitrospira sp.]|nr:SulP family inorganic anion transporter [Nitrospira sp.]
MEEPRTHHFEQQNPNIWDRLLFYVNPWDGRYEDVLKDNVPLNIFRDLAAGFIVALVAIPLAMGFAIASGLRPEQGIVGGALAAIIGALWGGSKYQVYGPTAAFIPIIAAMVSSHGQEFMILASICSGLIVMILGLARLGRFVQLVPDSIVVGFTIGIACVIVVTQMDQILGVKEMVAGKSVLEKIGLAWKHADLINPYTITLAIGTFLIAKMCQKISPFIPGPVIALGVSLIVSSTIWADKGIVHLKDKYGSMPTNFFVFTPPAAMQWDLSFLSDLSYYVLAIVFVAAIESLLSSRMADRLANNSGVPFNPNKELWGQGWVNVIIPMLNGFPHTGALARTATNIKVGAQSPLAGVFKCVIKLSLAAFLASYLEIIPLASIGGIMLYVAVNMVKPAEVSLVLAEGKRETAFLAYTALAVLLTDFLTGVSSALVLYTIVRFAPRPGMTFTTQQISK